MISSIFGKTKPINYIIVLAFLFLLYWVVHFFLFDRAYEPLGLLRQIGVLTLLSFSFFVVNFIVKRNKLTGTNSFIILFFVLLMVLFPEVLVDNSVILSNFFILLSLRRLISVRSLKSVKFKIFDGTLWIIVASFFYDWAILYLMVVFMTIYIYEPKNLKNWLVPLIAIFTAFMISQSILVLSGNPGFLLDHYGLQISFDLEHYLNWANSTKLVIYAILIVVIAIFALLKMGKSGIGKIVVARLVVFLFVLGLFISVLGTSEGRYPILLTFFPAAILLTNYVESIKRPNLREVGLILIILVPMTVFFSALILK